MYQKNFKYPDTKAHEFVIARLAKRGVSLDELAKLVYETQKILPWEPCAQSND